MTDLIEEIRNAYLEAFLLNKPYLYLSLIMLMAQFALGYFKSAHFSVYSNTGLNIASSIGSCLPAIILAFVVTLMTRSNFLKILFWVGLITSIGQGLDIYYIFQDNAKQRAIASEETGLPEPADTFLLRNSAQKMDE